MARLARNGLIPDSSSVLCIPVRPTVPPNKLPPAVTYRCRSCLCQCTSSVRPPLSLATTLLAYSIISFVGVQQVFSDLTKAQQTSITWDVMLGRCELTSPLFRSSRLSSIGPVSGEGQVRTPQVRRHINNALRREVASNVAVFSVSVIPNIVLRSSLTACLSSAMAMIFSFPLRTTVSNCTLSLPSTSQAPASLPVTLHGANLRSTNPMILAFNG